jgi:hypothetical protein
VRKLLTFLAVLGAVSRSFAQGVVDFDTVGWTFNGGAGITNEILTLTDGTAGENRSAWFRTPLFTGAFQASFTYQDIGGGGAEGIGFVVQNDPRGTNALGYGGAGLGYCNITPSVAVLLNLSAGAPGGASGFMLGTNGMGAEDLSGGLSGRSYQSTAPVNLDAGNFINVNLRYSAGILQVTFTDTIAKTTFQTNIPVDIPALTGGNTGLIGLTGSDGSVASHQTVGNFTFAPLPMLTVSRADASNMALAWPAAIAGFKLQTKTNLADANWSDVAGQVSQINGSNQVLFPSSAGGRFYRLATARLSPAGGLTAKGQISLFGGGVVDSFNSADPNYSTGGQYDPAKRKANARVLTDLGGTNAVAISIGMPVYGSVVAGPGGTFTVTSNGSIGDIAYIASNPGTVEVGHAAFDANVQLSDVAIPSGFGTGVAPLPGAYTYHGTNYSYMLGTGNYSTPSFSLNGGIEMVVTGTAALYVNGSFTTSGSSFIYISPGASLAIYLGGPSATISGSGIVNGTGSAANCSVYGLPSCTFMTFSAASSFTGVVYAPEASLAFTGSVSVVGAFSANTISLSGTTGFHYDESLAAAYR